MVFEAVLAQIPIWYEVKLVLVAWLVLPQFRGAALIYERFVREPLRKSNEFGVVEKDNLTNNNIKNKNSDFITSMKGQEKQEAY
ncbi:hypothetical protein HHK36_029366 [Tetracentron sinense]|uniref:HVA22-like protein n=1 Tax=Tetracentron sinense TaxID=13715 RepID=A0A834YAU9_TETSI|nr:hypothetical protein HHK36_029366 [Tetracentron sinense]